MQFLQELAEDSVPYGKPSSRATPWWTPEIERLVHRERKARRQWRDTGDEQNRVERQTLGREKKKLIEAEKRGAFRNDIHEASESIEGVWRLARYARQKGGKFPELPTMPPLNTGQGLARTVEDKETVLRARFFPESTAEIEDIVERDFSDCSFNDPLTSPANTTTEEIESAIKSQKSTGAPGKDSISIRFLKAMGKPFARALASLTTACWESGYYPIRFKDARTMTLKKPGKETYAEAGSWRPIALLSVVGKVIEKVTARRISGLAEEHKLLPDTQMGARKGRSTETASELLTEQIHTVWGAGKRVATLLSLDISGAFDTVNPIRLLDTLRKKRLPPWIVRFTKAFLMDRTASLVIQGHETASQRIPGGASQGSPLSPILFLFYNAELLEICNRPKEGISGMGFVDDTHILAYGKSTEDNCRRIELAHYKCLIWARKFGIKFAPQKYELIHFTRRRKGFNLAATVNLNGTIQEPKPDIRVLGVWVDTKLKWGAHLRAIQRKMPVYQRALTSVAGSTWGAAFRASRQVYTAVTRSAIAYGAGIWHTPSKGPKKPQGIATKLGPLQNEGLRAVAGTYKATPTRRVELETLVPPIHLYLDDLTARFKGRTNGTLASRVIQTECKAIRTRLRKKGQGRRRTKSTPQTPQQAKWDWAVEWCQRADELLPCPPKAGKKFLKLRRLLAHWKEEIRDLKDNKLAGTKGKLDHQILEMHDGLRKAESTTAIQLRTGYTGLAAVLRMLNVPGYNTGRCRCEQGRETVLHVLAHCSLEDKRRSELKGKDGFLNIEKLLNSEMGAARAARWMMQSGRLGQFALAKELLYG
jgi:hypothetical protein